MKLYIIHWANIVCICVNTLKTHHYVGNSGYEIQVLHPNLKQFVTFLTQFKEQAYFWSFEISVNILRNQKYIVGLDSYSGQGFNYLDPILIYISLWINCLFEIIKIAICYLWLSLPGHYRVTDEALLTKTT